MGSWNDPDLRKHIISEDKLRIGSFMDQISFVDRPKSTVTTPYIKMKIGHFVDVKLTHPSVGKLSDYQDDLREGSKSSSVTDDQSYRPMAKASAVYGKPYYYQFILFANNLFTLLDYDQSNRSTVNIPVDQVIYEIFSDFTTQKNAPTVKEIHTPEGVAISIKKLFLESAEFEYSISKWIEDKMYMSSDEIVNKIKNPLFVNYVSRELSKLKDGVDIPNVSLLRETLIKLLSYLDVYTREVKDDD